MSGFTNKRKRADELHTSRPSLYQPPSYWLPYDTHPERSPPPILAPIDVTRQWNTSGDGVATTAPPSHADLPNLLLTDQDVDLLDFPNARPTKSGGSCEVYLATYKPNNLVLAMKRPRIDFPTDDMLRRFRREAEMWSTFQHTNVLPFFGTMEINHRLYLVSPWMSLGDLLAFVQAHVELVEQGKDLASEPVHPAHSTFSEPRIVQEIAAGLEYLHAIGVIHGDIKAKNILLSSAGCPKICDFGLSKTTDHAVTSTELKGVGSLRWQSPELLHNAAKSPKSDVYAFGMTIAEVLTGNYPFPHLKQQTAVLLAIVSKNERPTFWPLSRLGVDFQPLWDLAAKCWQTEAEDRPHMNEASRQLKLMVAPTYPTNCPNYAYSDHVMPREALPQEPLPRSQPSPHLALLSTHSIPQQEASRPSGPSREAYPENMGAVAQSMKIPSGPSHPRPQPQPHRPLQQSTFPEHLLPVTSHPRSFDIPPPPFRPGEAKHPRRQPLITSNWAVPPRVLLVDDDQVSRILFSKFLQVSGCTIDTAVDGIGAVNKLNLEKYDLVLMDIVMPKLDGVGATSLIREFDHLTPIIAMTSHRKPNEVLHYYSNGMNDILPKPFTRAALFTMLEKHLTHLKATPQAGSQQSGGFPVVWHNRAHWPGPTMTDDEHTTMISNTVVRSGEVGNVSTAPGGGAPTVPNGPKRGLDSLWSEL